MDIDLLSKMVKELILDNDRVVLPGLGCFVAELVPSTFSDKGYTINPPYRRLYFRSKPDEGDELVKFYAQSNDVTLEMADRIVTDFVSELKSVLHVKKTVVFPGLGRLRATKENNVFFVADEELDIYPDGFGLEPISLKTNQETPEEVSAAVEGLKSLLETSTPELTPVAEPVAIPDVVPPAEPVMELTTEPAAEPAAEPVPESEQIIEPVQESVQEPVQESTPKPEPDPISEPVLVQPAQPVKKPSRKLLWTVLIVLIVAAVLFGVFFVLSRICPGLIDQLLYTKEELDIINYRL